jgi:hypothetical protein
MRRSVQTPESHEKPAAQSRESTQVSVARMQKLPVGPGVHVAPEGQSALEAQAAERAWQ